MKDLLSPASGSPEPDASVGTSPEGRPVDVDGRSLRIPGHDRDADGSEEPGPWVDLEQRRRLSARVGVAVREERARISRELDATTLKGLFGVRLRLYLAEALGAVDHAELERLREAIDAAISTTRAFISQLRRPVFELAGLAESLDLVLEGIATRAGVAYEVRDRLSEPPPLDVATVAYGMVDGVLSFIELHAGASRVEVELEERDRGLLVTIFDDGAGSTLPDEVGSDEWRQTTLDPIRGRLDSIGGRLDVVRSPGRGTRVELWFPFDAVPGTTGVRSEAGEETRHARR